MKFNILNENYEFKEGQVLAIFTLDDNPTEYIIYSVEDYETNESKILISHLVKDQDGIDHIKPIEDIQERRKIINVFKEILKGGNNNE